MARKYDWEKAFGIIHATLSGLHHAHTHKIIHTNIRPSNILFDENDVPKLTDFGLPAHYEPNKKRNWYNPPEHKTSKQGDIYSIGVVLHQLLTGRNPSYDNGGNLRIDDIKNELPEALRNMLTKFLAIRVSRRYTSCEEFFADYESFEEYRREMRMRKPVQKSRAPIIIEKKTPIWVYFLIALGGMVAALMTLYFTGYLH